MERPPEIETGTTTVGLACKDGVVLAADRRATAGTMIAHKRTKKVYRIDDNLGLTTAGLVGDLQVLARYITAEAELYRLKRSLPMSVGAAATPPATPLSPQDEAEAVIKEIIPAEAQITSVYFESDSGVVTIEALSPGLVIGRHGAVLNEIKKRVGGAPKVGRTPPIASKTVEEIRQYLRTVRDERTQFLKQVGRRLTRELATGESGVRITSPRGRPP